MGQTEKYQFTHVSTTDGLSQSSAIAIHQDKKGQIWVGTRDGLNKYDGTNFKVYRSHSSKTSLTNNDILTIEEDSDGNIWVGTYNGLNKYNPKTDEFTRYFHNENQSSLINNTVWIIKELSNGLLCIGTSGGLSLLDRETHTFTNYPNIIEQNSSTIDVVKAILQKKDGYTFVGTSNGLSKVSFLKDNSLKIETIKDFNGQYIQDLVEDLDSNILVATKSNGVLKYETKNGSLLDFEFNEEIKKQSSDVRQLLFDDENNLWVGTYNGLKVISPNKETVTLKSDFNYSNSLNKNSVKSLFKDKKGSIWVGTYYGGLNIWDKANINFRNITRNHGNSGLSYNVVSSIETFNDNVCFGTEGGGITLWNKKNNTYNYIESHQNKGLSDDNIKSLKVIGNKLWIGTFNSGVEIYNTETKNIEKHYLPKPLHTYLEDVGVYAIKPDNEQNIWIGTFGKGLISFNQRSQEFILFKHDSQNKSGLSNNFIRTVFIDSKNQVWVGTEKGLNKITKHAEITTFFYDDNLQYGDDILCVFEDQQNGIWVGSKAKGLFKLNGTEFVHIDLVDNVTISAIHSIQQDQDNNLWISSNQGIIRYNPANGQSKIFNQKDGIVGNEFNDNASLKVDDSVFYFGGPMGVTFFDTKTISTNYYTPQTLLTDFKVKNKSVDLKNENDEVLSSTLLYTDNIELDYDQGNFSISFSIPSFINSSNNRYKYRLKGLEEDWNFTTENTASYTIQNAGDFVFEVIGANNDNVWNKTATKLKITVAPAPWRSWWAFLIYALLISGALYFLIAILKSKTQLSHQLELEHIENEKNIEINKSKLEFFTNISHEFRTPLALILGPLSQIIQDYTGSNKVYKKLLVIESSANRLLHLINRLMDFRKFESNLYKLEAAEGNIVKFLKEIYLSFSEYARVGGYDFTFNASDDQIFVYYDRNKLERVFYNLISNAFRYTPKNGKISVSLVKKEKEVIIEVRDSGVGIAEEYQDKIFERFFEVEVNNNPDSNYNKGTGIGLSIAKNIVKLHHGEIGVRKNELGSGSVFAVKLLLGKAHLSDEDIIDNFKFSDDISQYVQQLDPPVNSKEDEIPDIPEAEKPCILLVEDHKPLRKFMKGILKENYNILEAENGKVAFNIAKKESPDLIVSDVVMPVMTGTALCSAMKNEIKTSHIPIILLTSRSSLIYKIEGLESGADDYISKPFNVNEFKIRIKNLLNATARIREKYSEIDHLQSSEILISSFDEKLYKKAINIVEDNIANEAFDIPFFASELGVSRTMLFTKVKAWTNFTPNEFIQHIRMKRAVRLLEQGKINVSQVSYAVGFKNPKYFSKCFQKKFGQTPSQYAEKFIEL